MARVAVIYYSSTGTFTRSRRRSRTMPSRRRGGPSAAGPELGHRGDRIQPGVAAYRAEGPPRCPRRRSTTGVGGRVRLRHPHPFRQPRRAAQAVHRPAGALWRRASSPTRRPPRSLRRQRTAAAIDHPRAQQRLPPLGRPHRAPRLHRPAEVRSGGNPYGTTWTSGPRSARSTSRPANRPGSRVSVSRCSPTACAQAATTARPCRADRRRRTARPASGADSSFDIHHAGQRSTGLARLTLGPHGKR